MTMVSDDGGTLNISVVCDDAYTKDGTVITVRFDAVGNSEMVSVTLQKNRRKQMQVPRI